MTDGTLFVFHYRSFSVIVEESKVRKEVRHGDYTADAAHTADAAEDHARRCGTRRAVEYDAYDRGRAGGAAGA